ncbi:E3 Ubiquitin ligase GIDE-type [Arabidopsis thaliana x Arabidopsis arenosa]|uniref:RING-type E3 ubiquitin transferase n=2 Tax=Arabidopsis thaliana x Arabidopsis arenosa TaxID=1240361 RepID=A0A8T1XB36_9BRAS|nr:E3 Ubiquitin ligase GIDE-type [Arabidopsis thaliana x Arabidopsis arenosa]
MIHLGGLTCCVSGGVLYLLSMIPGSFFEMLNSVTRVHQIKDLEKLLQVEGKIIAVSGIVGSHTPIKCEHSDTLCVFLEEKAQQLFLKRNWLFSWVEDSKWMLPQTKEVPWYLDDGTGCVNVVGAENAIALALKAGGEVFEGSKPSSDCLKGLVMLGVRRTEHVLPIGTPVTVVGEAVKDGIRGFRIQKPEKGLFFVSPVPLDKIISPLGKWLRRFKYVYVGLTVVGVILISKPVIEYILERRRGQLLRKRVADAAAKRAKLVARGLETQQENSLDSTSRDRNVLDLCVICLEQKYDATFVKCGHMCCCFTCSLHVKTCPLCRRLIELVLKIDRR